MYNVSLTTPIIYPDDFTYLQVFATFDNGNGSPITKSYTYQPGNEQDMLDQVNSDCDNLNANAAVVSASVATIQTALQADNLSTLSLAVQQNPVEQSSIVNNSSTAS